MRRSLVGLVVLGGTCLISAIVCGAVGVGAVERGLRINFSNTTAGPSDTADALFRVGYILQLATDLLVGGSLVAIVAIFALLAIRAERRRGARPAPAR